MKKACVIGYPISHSRSPLIHNHWLAKHGIDGVYEKREVRPEDLSRFLESLMGSGYQGCNVTIPHKEEALKSISQVDDIVRTTGSLNTVYIENGKLAATSTDGEGFYQNLLASVSGFDIKNQKVIVLGAGGSARPIIERLLRAGAAEIGVLNRTPARAEELRTIFGPAVKVLKFDHFVAESKSASLLVNTTSQGMKDQAPLEIDLSALPSNAVVADIVYVPLKTDLLSRAEALGLKTVSGLGMLLHQAGVGFEKWFDKRPEVTRELYDLVAKDVDPEYHP